MQTKDSTDNTVCPLTSAAFSHITDATYIHTYYTQLQDSTLSAILTSRDHKHLKREISAAKPLTIKQTTNNLLWRSRLVWKPPTLQLRSLYSKTSYLFSVSEVVCGPGYTPPDGRAILDWWTGRNLEWGQPRPKLLYHTGIYRKLLTKTTSNLSGPMLWPIFGLWTYPIHVTQCCTMQCHTCYASGRLDRKPAGWRIIFTIPVATAAINSKSCPRDVNRNEQIT